MSARRFIVLTLDSLESPAKGIEVVKASDYDALQRERDEQRHAADAYATHLADAERERDEARVEVAQLRELLNCYNLGGWTDAERLLRERDEARARLDEAVALLREARETGDPCVLHEDTQARIDAFLAKLGDK